MNTGSEFAVAVYQQRLDMKQGWYFKLQLYVDALDTNQIKTLDLCHSSSCLTTIIHFNITDDMRSTDDTDLKNHTVYYEYRKRVTC